jgi:hypothetical protein
MHKYLKLKFVSSYFCVETETSNLDVNSISTHHGLKDSRLNYRRAISGWHDETLIEFSPSKLTAIDPFIEIKGDVRKASYAISSGRRIRRNGSCFYGFQIIKNMKHNQLVSGAIRPLQGI